LQWRDLRWGEEGVERVESIEHAEDPDEGGQAGVLALLGALDGGWAERRPPCEIDLREIALKPGAAQSDPNLGHYFTIELFGQHSDY